MSGEVKIGFLVEIDGNLQGYLTDLDAAKRWAVVLAKGASSVKITTCAGLVPSSAWYWDYSIDDWVFVTNAGAAEPKRKGE